jgi:hypothetical protein
MVLPKRRSALNGQYGVISQMTEFFETVVTECEDITEHTWLLCG